MNKEILKMNNNISSLVRSILFISIPMIISNISIPLLGLIDTAIVGRIGTIEIGSVAIGAATFSLIYWSFSFLRMCTTGFVAQSWGGRKEKEVEEILQKTISIAIFCGILIILLLIPLRNLCLLLLGPSEEIKMIAIEYINIRIWGAPAVFMNFVIMGILIGSNKPWNVLVITLFTNLINIILDFYLGVFLAYEVKGIAYGTLIAEWSGIILGLIIIKKTFPKFQIFNINIKLNTILKRIISSNINFFIRTILLLVSIMMFTAIGARLGDLVLAVNAILILLQMFLSYGLDGFAQAAEVLVGNSYGSKNKILFKKVTILTGLISFIAALAYSLIYLFYGLSIIKIITNINEVIIAAEIYLPWIALSPVISFLSFHLDGVFIGASKTKIMRNSMIFSFLIYISAIIILVPMYQNHGLWASFLIFMFFRGLTLLVRYKSLVI